jgi:hypothetical protein
MEDEVKTGELFVFLEKRPKNNICCDSVTERIKDTLQQTRPAQIRIVQTNWQGNSR